MASTAEVLYCSNSAPSLSPLQFLPFFTPITSSLCKNPESFRNPIHKLPLASCFITRNGTITTTNNNQIPNIPSFRNYSQSIPSRPLSSSLIPGNGTNNPIPKIPFSSSRNHGNNIPKVPLSSPCFITTNGTTSNNKQIPKIPSSRSSWRSNSYPEPETPESQCPVPGEQLPINEYRSLSASFPFSWAAGDSAHHLPSRLLTTAVSFALFVGLPVASCSPTSAHFELARRLLGAASSGVFAATLVAVRMYLGWAYVGNRLFSATVPYEETGWYDGQVWVKTAEVLARDRLLGTFSVKPVLSRLKFTLVVLASILLASVLLLINLEGHEKDLYISHEHRSRVIAGVYSEQSARLFEPDAFCGEPDLP